jgi:UDP-2-acetamido-3-amino-2,3-dideoxy-glucuronate N-acetyltransferase
MDNFLRKEGEIKIYIASDGKGEFKVHESSYIDEGAKIGKGTRIWHFSHIMKGAIIGENCSIGQNVNVGAKAIIGNGVKIQNNVSIYDDVILEDDVFCGPSMVFTNVINPRAFIERKHEYKKTIVKKGASIGANATIVCGTIINEYAFVAAGAVVSRDVEPYALVMGVPAKRSGWVCKCGEILVHKDRIDGELVEKDKIKCKSCGSNYFYDGNIFKPI